MVKTRHLAQTSRPPLGGKGGALQNTGELASPDHTCMRLLFESLFLSLLATPCKCRERSALRAQRAKASDRIASAFRTCKSHPPENGPHMFLKKRHGSHNNEGDPTVLHKLATVPNTPRRFGNSHRNPSLLQSRAPNPKQASKYTQCEIFLGVLLPQQGSQVEVSNVHPKSQHLF